MKNSAHHHALLYGSTIYNNNVTPAQNVETFTGTAVTLPTSPSKYYLGLVTDPYNTIKQLSLPANRLELIHTVGPATSGLPPAGVVSTPLSPHRFPNPPDGVPIGNVNPVIPFHEAREKNGPVGTWRVRSPPGFAGSPPLTPALASPYNRPPEGPWPGSSPVPRTESIRRMSRRYVNQLSHGDSIDESYLVADKQLRANRQGNLYLQLELRDKTGSVGARLWNASEELARSFEPGDYLRVRGKTQIFQGSLQVILTHIDVLDPNRVEAEDFLPRSSQNAAKLMARLREVLLTMNNPHLRA